MILAGQVSHQQGIGLQGRWLSRCSSLGWARCALGDIFNESEAELRSLGHTHIESNVKTPAQCLMHGSSRRHLRHHDQFDLSSCGEVL